MAKYCTYCNKKVKKSESTKMFVSGEWKRFCNWTCGDTYRKRAVTTAGNTQAEPSEYVYTPSGDGQWWNECP